MTHDTKFVRLALELISNPEGHNRPIDPQHVDYLANAIRMHGLQHPVVVVPNSKGGYDLVAGLHRLNACKQLGFDEIDCKLLPKGTDEATLLEISISENLSRKSETFSETLARIDHIMRVKKCSFEEAAKGANVHKSMTSKCKRVKDLCDAAKALIHQHPEKLGISIAYAVVRHATTDEKQVRALEGILNGSLTRDSLKDWLSEPAVPREKMIPLKLTLGGIAVRLGIPESTDWDGLEAFVNALKSLLMGEKKHKRLVCELPNHLGEV